MLILFFKRIFFWFYVKTHTWLINIGLTMYNVETDMFKVNPNITDEKDKKIERKRHRNQMLENFYAGKRDEKTIQSFYEILKKSDEFIRNATEYKMAVAADKHGSNYGLKDKWGRRYEHYGFFDEKHKHSGKTLGSILELELMERRTTDDEYPIVFIFNNKPIEPTLTQTLEVLKKGENENEYIGLNTIEKSKLFDFPIKIYRNNDDVKNKIEQLTDFLHVKHIGLEHYQLEFFIPFKFNTKDLENDCEIIKELFNFDEVYIKHNYNEMLSYSEPKFLKRIETEHHDVFKFMMRKMEFIEK